MGRKLESQNQTRTFRPVQFVRASSNPQMTDGAIWEKKGTQRQLVSLLNRPDSSSSSRPSTADSKQGNKLQRGKQAETASAQNLLTEVALAQNQKAVEKKRHKKKGQQSNAASTPSTPPAVEQKSTTNTEKKATTSFAAAVANKDNEAEVEEAVKTFKELLGIGGGSKAKDIVTSSAPAPAPAPQPKPHVNPGILISVTIYNVRR